MKNKKGSAMIEAAMIFPIMILTIITVIYITVGFYAESILSTAMHMKLTTEAGNLSGTITYCENEADRMCADDIISDGIKIMHENTIFKNEVIGETHSRQKIGGLIETESLKIYRDTANVIDEEVYIRCADAATGLTNVEAY